MNYRNVYLLLKPEITANLRFQVTSALARRGA